MRGASEKPKPQSKAYNKHVDNRIEIAMRGGKRNVYHEILARYKNGESLEHIKNVALRSVKALDKQINKLTEVNDMQLKDVKAKNRQDKAQ